MRTEPEIRHFARLRHCLGVHFFERGHENAEVVEPRVRGKAGRGANQGGLRPVFAPADRAPHQFRARNRWANSSSLAQGLDDLVGHFGGREREVDAVLLDEPANKIYAHLCVGRYAVCLRQSEDVGV